MKLPGPLGWLSLVASLSLAAAPATMAILSFAEGNLELGVAFLAIAVVAFAVPEYVLRQIPGPVEAVKRRLPFVGSGKRE